MDYKYDLVCIGSGPAGQRAAVQACKLGKKVALIEKSNDVGGICLHTGTIPSKTFREAVLLQSSKTKVKNIDGLTDKSLDQLFKDVQKIIDNEVMVNNDQLSRNDVHVFHGEAVFLNTKEILVKSEKDNIKLQSEFFLISVGANAIKPQGLSLNKKNIITSDEIFNLKVIPKSLSIIGCGVIGIEYASMFAKLGVEVTIIDGRDRPLEFLDSEILDELIIQIKKMGVVFKLNENVKDIEIIKDEQRAVLIHLKSGKKVLSELAILCAGRKGSTENLNLEKVNVNVDDRGRIIVDKKFRSSTKNIFAAGDVIGFPSLAATSFEQGRLASLHMFKKNTNLMSPNFPVGIYSIPEVSMVGQNENQLIEKNVPYETGIARYKEISRGNILDDKVGLLKLIVHRDTKQILGVHILGTNATELIHIGQCAIELEGGLEYFLNSVFNYPTLAECYKVAALNVSNKLYL